MKLSYARSGQRRAAAMLELAIGLSVLIPLFVAATDFCRAFYYAGIVSNCARAGAVFASDPSVQPQSPFYDADSPDSGTSAAAVADWPSTLGPVPPVSVTSQTIDGHPHKVVTVSFTFRPFFASFVGSATINIVRTARARVTPATPNYT